MISTFRKQASDWVWDRKLFDMPPLERMLVRFIRLLICLVRDMLDGQTTMRAMGLVYTSLLSIVPMLALGFSLLKAFGIHNKLEPALITLLEPLGDNASEISTMVIGFVGNVKVGVLGSVGLALLIYAALSLIQKVESALNFIWKVDRPRSFARRFSEYLSVLLVGPLLISLSLAMTASVMNNSVTVSILSIEPFGSLMLILSRLFPYFLISAGFTFLYIFIPNTRVRLPAALAGGLVAGFLWQTASWSFASFVKGSSNYDAIYSSFAILIFLLIWLYVSWLILLAGCRLAFLVQHPEYVTRNTIGPHMGGRMQEHLALLIMMMVGDRFSRGDEPLAESDLARTLNAPPEWVYMIVDLLLEAGLLVETSETDVRLMPGKDLDSINIRELLNAIRDSDPMVNLTTKQGSPYEEVNQVMQTYEDALNQSLGDTSLKTLLSGQTPSTPHQDT